MNARYDIWKTKYERISVMSQAPEHLSIKERDSPKKEKNRITILYRSDTKYKDLYLEITRESSE